MVGDSYSLAYRYLIVDAPGYFPRPVATSAHCIRNFSSELILEDGHLASGLLSFLKQQLVIEDRDGWRPYQSDIDIENATWRLTAQKPLHDEVCWEGMPPLLLILGALDLAKILGRIGPNADFFLDDERFVERAFDEPDLPTIPFDVVYELVEERLRPIGTALRLLREIGFEELYLHSIAPPTLDDVLFFRIRNIMCSAKLRYKVAIVMNQVFERFARESGARFLDMWQASVIGGVIDHRLEIDGDHPSRLSVKQSLEALLNDIAARRGVFVEG